MIKSSTKSIHLSTGLLRLPKGTQDYFRDSYNKLDYLKNEITKLFNKYHGEFVETPVFELTHVLMNKYGEEEKLIFNIESNELNESKESNESNESIEKCVNQKEHLSLRYDHTIPLVRFCILNGIKKMRRCCIGKAYRRETTSKSQVRLREFYQADFDFVGSHDNLVPEIEIMCMIQQLFRTINISNYQILYNYRQNLDYYVQKANIDPSKFATVCSSIDKLDKHTPEYVHNELLEKGLTIEQITSLFECLFSKTETPIMEESVKTLDDNFRHYINTIKILDTSKIVFSPTLARGSDYYTGIIFEVKIMYSDSESTIFTSSVAGGGRYDKLIGSYSKIDDNNNNNFNIINNKKDCPMIGFSFGIDRLIPFIKYIPYSKTLPKIWISTIGKIANPIDLKLEIVGKMMNMGYGVFYNLSDRKFKKEIVDANEIGCNFMIIIGEREWVEDQVSIRNMDTRVQITIKFDKIYDYFDNI